VKRELLFISFDLFSFSQMFPLFLLLQLRPHAAAAASLSFSKESASQRQICIFNLGRGH